VIVSRTFSKIYGMAGLRIGYAIGHRDALSALHPHLDGFRLSVLSMRAATAALEAPTRVPAQRRDNHDARALTADALRQAGYRVVDSEANFLMTDVRRDIRVFQQACRSRGVEIARPFPPLLTWARITIGTPDEMRHAVGVFTGALDDTAPAAMTLPPVAPHVPRRDGTWAC
jgi:histidinol-phosphate aminotransferase